MHHVPRGGDVPRNLIPHNSAREEVRGTSKSVNDCSRVFCSYYSQSIFSMKEAKMKKTLGFVAAALLVSATAISAAAATYTSHKVHDFEAAAAPSRPLN